MFGNKGFGWKLAGALAVVAGMGLLSRELGRDIHPALWRCTAQPARWDGAALWLPKVTVTASDAAGFEIEMDGVRARAVPAKAVAPGDTIALTGTWRAEGPSIQVKKVRPLPPSGTRALQEWVSIPVLALILLNLLRHFAFRPKAVQLEGAD